jgi:hypothetical protein
MIHYVIVSNASIYGFEPPITVANKGDVVVFEFFSTDFSVARSEYANAAICPSAGCNPCVPWEEYHTNGGFNSGNGLKSEVEISVPRICFVLMSPGIHV